MQLQPSIRRRRVCGLLIALFAAVLLAPLFQQLTGLPRDKRLGGFRNRTREFPRWTWRAWRRGEFATQVEAWSGEHIGGRGWLVHLDRQVRYSLFGQTEAAPLRRRALVIGTPPVLFENIVVLDAIRPPQIAPATLDAFAARLARLQALLRERGMAFLVVVAPNKARVDPAALPGWARARAAGHDTDCSRFVGALGRHGVPCLDTVALFRELQPAHPNLVPPHAIHWGHHGAWLALQRAIPLINAQRLLPDIPLPVTEGLVQDKPSHMNDELRGQLNLFRSRHGDPIPSDYPIAAPPPPGAAGLLDVLIVGDSFAFTFMDALARSGLCRGLHLWFYMQSGKEGVPSFDSRVRRGIPTIGGTGMGGASPENAARMLTDRNLVLLVVAPFNIDKFAWGFDRLVFRMYGAPDPAPLPGADAPVDFEN